MMQFHRLALLVLIHLFLATSCRERPAKTAVASPPPASLPAETKALPVPAGGNPAATATQDIPANAQVANPGPIKAAVMKYYQTEGRFPNDWETLVKQKYLPTVPKTASGQPVDFRAFMRHHSL